jgi:hypothetical protein
MTPEQIERVFGRGRLKMVTGEHVEVFREAVAPGERRRYTKRFLSTQEGDFGQWTEREWRILARLIGHGITCVPDVVQFDRGRVGGMQLVQTYDAGVTVDQWATLLPVMRDGSVQRHVFEDCAHWWALAHYCLLALNEVHRLELVHLDIKGDNVCIPFAPANFDPHSSDLTLRPVFAQFALIDFAFALVSRESLTTPLPIGWQEEYDYQSPRLLTALEAGRNGDLQLTRELDWRCDMYSVAAMLKRYLPDESSERAAGWTSERYDAAKALILRVREAHDDELPARRPHAELIEASGARLAEAELAHSLERGWTLARESAVAASASPLTPVTRVAPITRIVTPIHVTRSGRTAITVVPEMKDFQATRDATPALPPQPARPVQRTRRARGPVAFLALVAAAAVGAALWLPIDRAGVSKEKTEALLDEGPPTVAANQSSSVAASKPSAVAANQPPPAQAAAQDRARAMHAPPAQAAPEAPKREAGDTAQGEARRDNVAVAPAQAPVRTASSPSVSPAHPLPSIASLPQPSSTPQRAEARAPAAESYRAQDEARAATSRTPPATGSTAPRATQDPVATNEARTHPSWASLEPPAWVTSRKRSPGLPPGFKAREQEAPVNVATEASIKSAPLETAAPAVEITQPALQPAPLATVDPPREAPRAQTITPQLPAATAGGDERPATTRAAPRLKWFNARSAAPVEDRSENLSLALAPAAPAARGSSTPPQQHRADEFTAQSQRMPADALPRLARQGEPEVAHVLQMAAGAYRPTQDRAVADAARTTRIRDNALQPTATSASGEARRLHDQARAAFVSGRNVREALDLQLRAFNANPRDPEIAGYLAVLYLKVTPSQPDLAREAALVALTARSPQYATTRIEDWDTLAVASALSGREADARNALFVRLSLSASVDRTCAVAWNALANYGERMRGPVEAMLYRVHTRGHSYTSPWCAWPPDWSSPPRLAGSLSASQWQAR